VYILWYREQYLKKLIRLKQTIPHQLLNGVLVFLKECNRVGNGIYDAPHEEIGLNFLVLVREGVIETVEVFLCDHGNTRLFGASGILGNRRSNVLGPTFFHLSFVHGLGGSGGFGGHCCKSCKRCKSSKARRATEGGGIHGV
jgi:hypothetical protein